MKNTYLYKLVIVATSLVMVYFASGIASIAQSTELLKAESVKQASLITQAQTNLALTLPTIAIAPNSITDSAKSMLAKKAVTTVQNNKITVSKTTLVSE